MWPFSKVRFKKFWFFSIGSLLINTTWQNHFWWTWSYLTFYEGLLWRLFILLYWTVVNKYCISWPYLMDMILCDFFRKSIFKHLEVKYWFYWTVFNKCFIPRPYLMNRILCDFFQKSVLNILEGKNWIY